MSARHVKHRQHDGSLTLFGALLGGRSSPDRIRPAADGWRECRKASGQAGETANQFNTRAGRSPVDDAALRLEKDMRYNVERKYSAHLKHLALRGPVNILRDLPSMARDAYTALIEAIIVIGKLILAVLLMVALPFLSPIWAIFSYRDHKGQEARDAEMERKADEDL